MASSPKKSYPAPVRAVVYAVTVLAVAWLVKTVADTRQPKMAQLTVDPSEMMCSAEPVLEQGGSQPRVRIVAILGDDEASQAAGAAAQAAVLARADYASLVTVDVAEATEQMALYKVQQAPALIFLDGDGVEKSRLVADFDTDKAVAAVDGCLPEGCGGCGGGGGGCGVPTAPAAGGEDGCGTGGACALPAAEPAEEPPATEE